MATKIEIPKSIAAVKSNARDNGFNFIKYKNEGRNKN
jgi:hypothetical protein